MKNVMVTGGCGFIGRNLTEHLITNGCNVVVIDNFYNSDSNQHSVFAPLLKADITTSCGIKTIESILKYSNIDTIFHFAAVSGVDDCENNVKLAEKTNIDGTRNLIRLANKYQVKRFIFASSSAVYGDTNTPNYIGKTLKPVSNYGRTKHLGELAVEQVFENTSVILRFANVFGYGQNLKYGAVVPSFIESAISNQQIEIHGDGKQSRSFIHIDCLCELIFCHCFSMPHLKRTNFKFNLCSEKTIDINTLAEYIKRKCKSKSDIIHTKPRPKDIKISLFKFDDKTLVSVKNIETKLNQTIEKYRRINHGN